MILTLKKAYNPGDADPGKTYTHLHLELLVYNSSAFIVQLSYAYGFLDSDNLFVPGKSLGLQSISVEGEDLGKLQSAKAQDNEPALPACLRIAYELLKQKLGIDGTLDYDLPASPAAAAPTPTAPQEGTEDT